MHSQTIEIQWIILLNAQKVSCLSLSHLIQKFTTIIAIIFKCMWVSEWASNKCKKQTNKQTIESTICYKYHTVLKYTHTHTKTYPLFCVRSLNFTWFENWFLFVFVSLQKIPDGYSVCEFLSLAVVVIVWHWMRGWNHIK